MISAIKILVIIACIIGILWSLLGIFGGAFFGAMKAVLENEQEAKKLEELYLNNSLRHIGSFAMIILGLIFGIVGSGKKAKKLTSIINGILLLTCGVLAFIWYSYFTGIIYVLCGFLLIITGLISKTGMKK